MILETGTKYQLILEGPTTVTKGRVSISIRMKEGFFLESSNTVGVILDKELLMQVYEDLGNRLDEMK